MHLCGRQIPEKPVVLGPGTGQPEGGGWHCVRRRVGRAWDCWGFHGEMEHVNKPVPNSTPEAAMDELLSKARFVFGDKPWHEWKWEAREYGTGTTAPRTIS
jgi:hypothetical protein